MDKDNNFFYFYAPNCYKPNRIQYENKNNATHNISQNYANNSQNYPLSTSCVNVVNKL